MSSPETSIFLFQTSGPLTNADGSVGLPGFGAGNAVNALNKKEFSDLMRGQGSASVADSKGLNGASQTTQAVVKVQQKDDGSGLSVRLLGKGLPPEGQALPINIDPSLLENLDQGALQALIGQALQNAGFNFTAQSEARVPTSRGQSNAAPLLGQGTIVAAQPTPSQLTETAATGSNPSPSAVDTANVLNGSLNSAQQTAGQITGENTAALTTSTNQTTTSTKSTEQAVGKPVLLVPDNGTQLKTDPNQSLQPTVAPQQGQQLNVSKSDNRNNSNSTKLTSESVDRLGQSAAQANDRQFIEKLATTMTNRAVEPAPNLNDEAVSYNPESVKDPAMAAMQSKMDSQFAKVETLHPVQTPVGKAGWSEAVYKQVMWMSSQQMSRASIALDPPELGPLHVQISTHQDQTSVVFTSAHSSVRDALDQNIARLREMMENQGLDLVDVNVADQGSSGSDRSDNDQDGDADGTLSLSADGTGSEPEDDTQTTVRVSQGLVDDYI